MLIGGAGLVAQTFQETLGITSDDLAEQIIQTSDGGYVVVGSQDMYGNDYDIYLTRLDASGVEQWTRRYYGPLDEFGYDVKEVDRDSNGTLDGYAIVGTSKSSNSGDICLVVTDYNGVFKGSSTYGGSGSEEGYSIIQMADYGYLICGNTTSYGRPYSGATNLISGNVFVVRTNSNLEPLWSTVISSDELTPDYGYSAIETLAGDIMLTGALGGAGLGGKDIAVVKLDQNGAWQWSDSYGSPYDDAGYEIREVIDQGVSTGFVVAATVEGHGTGGSDAALLRLDVNGNYLWHRVYGGVNDDAAYSVAFTPSGGFALCGTTNSFGFGSTDVYVVETDASGALLNSFTYGGTGSDEGRSIRATTGPGYIICGNTDSFGAGMLDEYIIKTDGVFFTPCHYQTVSSSDFPGPSDMANTPPWAIIHMACTDSINNNTAVSLTEDVLCADCTCNPQPIGQQRAYGSNGFDSGYNISEMGGSELLIAGETASYSSTRDMYVSRTDPSGNLLWSSAIWKGSTNNENQNAIAALEMPNGNIFVAGTTDDGTDMEVFVVVLDPAGGLSSVSGTFNPTPGITDAEAVDAKPVLNNSGNVIGFLVLARLTGNNTGPDVYLLEFDAAGTFASATILDQTSMTGYFPTALEPTDDNGDGVKDDGWLIAGFVTDIGSEGSVIIKTDAGLLPIWQRIYQFSPTSDFPCGRDIVQIDSDNDGKQDDEYALCGTINVSSDESFIALIDPGGSVVGGTATSYAPSAIVADFYAITQTCDNDLVLTGELDSQIWQMRTDVGLNSICATAYSTMGQGFELLQTSDQGIAIIGQSYNMNNSSTDAYLVKTNCNCTSGCNETSLTATLSTKVFVPGSFTLATSTSSASNSAMGGNSIHFDETPICNCVLINLPEEITPVNEYMPMDSQLDKIEPVNSNSATDVDDETLNEAMLEIYPNPVQNGSTLNVNFNSRAAARVSVKVTNVLGAVIGEYPLNAVPGEQSLQLDTSDWAPGTYTMTLNNSEGAAASSIVVVVR